VRRNGVIVVAATLAVAIACKDSGPGGPRIIATSPDNGANKTFLRTPIVITFDRQMDATPFGLNTVSIRNQGNNLLLEPTFSYDRATHQLFVTPSEDIAAPTSYLVIVSGNVVDSTGTAMGSDYQFTFSTGDGTAPVIASRTPQADATNVPLNTIIRVTFSEDMDPRFVKPTVGGFFLENLSGSSIEGVVAYDAPSRTATYTPRFPLGASTSYRVRVVPWITDLSGMPIGSEVKWTFTTVSQ